MGLKVGDMILAVNGKSAFNAYTYSQFPSASGNPYVRYVLCNQGDKDVELLIQSAERGKKVKLQMRPRLEDRIVLVDTNGRPLGN